MTELQWDQVGEHVYETGVDHGVLYLPDEDGVYATGVAWNGLTTVTESPTGAEANAQYADNIKYLNLYSAEEFGATIEAYTYPDEFNQFDGLASPVPGVTVGGQKRLPFGFCYRTLMGNDTLATSFGYKLHMVWSATATPSDKAYSTVNDSPEPINFSWAIATLPISVEGLDPTSIIVVDSTKVDADKLTDLELVLYGSVGVDPRLPLPDEVISILDGGVAEVIATTPAFNSTTGVITIPTVTGVQYKRADTGAVLTAGAQAAIAAGATRQIVAVTTAGYIFGPLSDDDWSFTRDP